MKKIIIVLFVICAFSEKSFSMSRTKSVNNMGTDKSVNNMDTDLTKSKKNNLEYEQFKKLICYPCYSLCSMLSLFAKKKHDKIQEDEEKKHNNFQEDKEWGWFVQEYE